MKQSKNIKKIKNESKREINKHSVHVIKVKALHVKIQ